MLKESMYNSRGVESYIDMNEFYRI